MKTVLKEPLGIRLEAIFVLKQPENAKQATQKAEKNRDQDEIVDQPIARFLHAILRRVPQAGPKRLCTFLLKWI